MWIKKTQAVRMSDGSAENLGITSFPRFFVLLSTFGRLVSLADKAKVRNSSGVSGFPQASRVALVKYHIVPAINNYRTDNLFQDFCKERIIRYAIAKT